MADSFLVNLSERWAQGSSDEATISVVFEFGKWTTVTGLLPPEPFPPLLAEMRSKSLGLCDHTFTPV